MTVLAEDLSNKLYPTSSPLLHVILKHSGSPRTLPYSPLQNTASTLPCLRKPLSCGDDFLEGMNCSRIGGFPKRKQAGRQAGQSESDEEASQIEGEAPGEDTWARETPESSADQAESHMELCHQEGEGGRCRQGSIQTGVFCLQDGIRGPPVRVLVFLGFGDHRSLFLGS